MDVAETLRWTGRYLGLWLLAAVVGGATVAAGVALGGLAPLGLDALTPAGLSVRSSPTVGLAVIALGLLVFRFGSAAALVHVVVSASEERLETALATEALKSDILSVLDARLSEMHEDLRETRRLASRGGDADRGFEFE